MFGRSFGTIGWSSRNSVLFSPGIRIST